MKIEYHRKFVKMFGKLPPKIRERFNERLRLFAVNPHDQILSNHSVELTYPGWRSIDITGDYRALFEPRGNIAVFMKIGTHAQLYG